jgi:hypothetical protein
MNLAGRSPVMHSRIPLFIFLVSFLLVLNSCGKNETVVQRSFYYWKNNSYTLSNAEGHALKELGSKKLYVKFFEVKNDETFGTIPVAKTHLRLNRYALQEDSVLAEFIPGLEVIPVVFVKNEIFPSASDGSLDSLADNINFLVGKYYNSIKNETNSYYDARGGIDHSFKEIQIDCDWTIKTQERYFYLLKALKKISGKTISCTLRLYPYKYPGMMGIPPVDKATLMCYNLVNPLENENRNSILDTDELEKYLAGVKPYPLPLDVALPVFSWMQVYQGNTFAGIISEGELDKTKDLSSIKPLWYEVKADVTTSDLYLREGDKIKHEEVTEETINKTIALLKENIDFGDTLTITFFHLDEAALKHYSNETLNDFYTDFSR